MTATRLLPLALTLVFATLGDAAPLPVIARDAKAHVTAAALEREAGIVVKGLPGRAEFVACGPDRCAPVKSVLTSGDTMLVPVAGLSDALNLTANFDEGRRHVTFISTPRGADNATGLARVGAIAPNLRLTKLDGTPVTLDEFRGQRVLINSWASW
jgi:hypothetical protein